jgi:parvulin-like peptidyl-prolyl isomerase
MTRFSLLAALLAALALVAGCGGDSSGSSVPESVPKGDVAVVGDHEIPVSQLDKEIAQKIRAAKIAKQKVPKAGTAEYDQAVVQPVVQTLVFRAQLQDIADQLGLEAGSDEVQKRLDQNIKQYYGGDRKKFEADLKRYQVSEQQVLDQVRLVILQEKLQKKLEGEVKVTDADVKKYYDQHKSQYATQDSRDVRFVLVDTKALAERLRTQLMNGGSWKQIAKKYSNDPGSAAQGGKFSVQRGAVVPQFEKAAFSLDQGEFSEPVKAPASYVGSACKKPCYFVIMPTGPVKKGTQQSFDSVESTIKNTLVSQRKTQHVQQRAQALRKAEDKITRYAPAYRPPETTPANAPSGG